MGRKRQESEGKITARRKGHAAAQATYRARRDDNAVVEEGTGLPEDGSLTCRAACGEAQSAAQKQMRPSAPLEAEAVETEEQAAAEVVVEAVQMSASLPNDPLKGIKSLQEIGIFGNYRYNPLQGLDVYEGYPTVQAALGMIEYIAPARRKTISEQLTHATECHAMLRARFMREQIVLKAYEAWEAIERAPASNHTPAQAHFAQWMGHYECKYNLLGQHPDGEITRYLKDNLDALFRGDEPWGRGTRSKGPGPKTWAAAFERVRQDAELRAQATANARLGLGHVSMESLMARRAALMESLAAANASTAAP